MKKRAKAGEWTEAHRLEALRRTYEIAAEFVGGAKDWTGLDLADVFATRGTVRTGESTWREHMRLAGLDPARIDREVRRVRALAEGRLVRETVWYREGTGRGAEEAYSTKELARGGVGWSVVRVTRIRRSSS